MASAAVSLPSAPALNFCMDAASTTSTTSEIIDEYKAAVDSVASVADPTFESTFVALADADAIAAEKSVVVVLPSLVSMDSEARVASGAAKAALKDMWSATYMRSDVYSALVKASESVPGDDSECVRLRDALIRKFEANGLGTLDAAGLTQLEALRGELTALEGEFERNLNEDDTTVWFTGDALDGVGESFMGGLPTREGEGGVTEYGIGLKRPTSTPVLMLADNETTRETLAYALNKKCMDTNSAVLDAMAAKRAEIAQLLGADHHAQLQLAKTMAATAEKVFEFLYDIGARLSERCAADKQALAELKAELTGNPDAALEPWDTSYYSHKLKTRVHDVDDEVVREYFPLDHVVAGTLAVYEETLGLKFEKLEGATDVWHEDVTKFSVADAATGTPLGHFFFDLFPRPGKYAHQCVFPIRPAFTLSAAHEGREATPMCAILGNMSKPTPTEPSLLRFFEAVTFFHEFGHVMHQILSKSRFVEFSWSWSVVPWPGGVEMDFLEAPSQMLENWVYERDVLARLSSHHKTGEVLPDDLIARIKGARTFNKAFGKTNQIVYSLFDMIIHTQSPPYTVDDVSVDSIAQLWPVLKDKFSMPRQLPDTNPAASFYHMCQGYDAGYYGYLWSEVYSYDMFSVFQEGGGCLDSELGAHYRREILEPGATRDGMDMLKRFLGREPSDAPFLKAVCGVE